MSQLTTKTVLCAEATEMLFCFVWHILNGASYISEVSVVLTWENGIEMRIHKQAIPIMVMIFNMAA